MKARWLGWFTASALLVACSRPHSESGHTTAAASAAAPAASSGSHEGAHADAHGEGDEHGHGDADHERSDLDRPVDELFSSSCEHDKKTFACDECRYEVGVTKAPRDLFDGKLLRLEKVEPRPVEHPIELTGEVELDDRRIAHVSAPVEGIIRAVKVALGDKVKKGQLLVEVHSVALGEAQASSREAASLEELARAAFARHEELRKQGVTSEREFQAARQEHEAARIRAEAARNKLGLLGAGAGGPIALRAPVDGTVLEMHAVPGELARPETPIVTVGDNDALWVWVNAYERDIATLLEAQGQQPLSAGVRVKAYPDREFMGTVDFVSPRMDHATRTVKVRVSVPNGERRLLAGMFASVRVYLPTTEKALSAPLAAVLDDEGRRFVFVRHHDDFFVRRPVTVGRTFAGRVEILKGVSAGQEVVSDGAFLLKSDVLRSKMGAGCAD